VDRIEDEVRSELLQDELQDKVQSGKELSNPEASKVYDIEVEKGVGPLKSIRITAHAQYRMDLRGVTVQELRLFFARFLKYVEAQKAKPKHSPEFVKLTQGLAYGEPILWTEQKMGLSVAFTVKNMEAHVVTTYWEGLPDPKPSSCNLRRAADSLRKAYGDPDVEFSTYTRIIDRGSTEPPMDTASPLRAGPFDMGKAENIKPTDIGLASPGRTLIPGDRDRPTPQWQPYPTKNRTALLKAASELRIAADLIQVFGPSTFDEDFENYPSSTNPGYSNDTIETRGITDQYDGYFKNNPVPSNGSGKVIPYVSETDFANRTAAKAAQILQGVSPDVLSKAKSIKPKLARVDKKNATWTFKVPGSKEAYTVKIKMLPGRANSTKTADLALSCTCNDWVYGGAEYHAKKGGYLLGKPQGTATPPDVRDPDGVKRICKHVAAVLAHAEGYSMDRKASMDHEARANYPGKYKTISRTDLVKDRYYVFEELPDGSIRALFLDGPAGYPDEDSAERARRKYFGWFPSRDIEVGHVVFGNNVHLYERKVPPSYVQV
jgi:hypothetical protein